MGSTKLEELQTRHCRPCEGGVTPLSASESQRLLESLPGWQLAGDGTSIRRQWQVRDFAEAMRFLQQLAALAEAENHHPDLHLTGYRHVAIELSTHAIGGLSENDFILAAKIADLPVSVK